MSWALFHRQSEELAAEAHAALHNGDIELAKKLFGKAAQAEKQAFQSVPSEVDDLIGPMVNREVDVRVRFGNDNNLIFIDIEQDE